MCVPPVPQPAYLSHLLLPLRLGGLGVRVVVRLDDDQVVALGVNDEFAGCVLQGEGHLVEDCPQLLQCQNPGGQRRERRSTQSGGDCPVGGGASNAPQRCSSYNAMKNAKAWPASLSSAPRQLKCQFFWHFVTENHKSLQKEWLL